MFKLIRILMIGALLVSSHSTLAEQKEYPKTDEAVRKAFDKLDFKTESKKICVSKFKWRISIA